MKLAVTDSSVFIDLFEVGELNSFFGLPFEMHTTSRIFSELHSYQQEELESFVRVGKLTVHTLSDADWDRQPLFDFSRALSEPDQSVLMYAHDIQAIVLSGDMAIRKKARQMGLEFHGIIWIFEQMVACKRIGKELALTKLNALLSQNLLYRSSQKMRKAVQDLKEKWAMDLD